MKPVARRTVWRAGTGRPDDLAEEMPVAFGYNGISHAARLAAKLNLALIGFLREEACVIHTGSKTLPEHSA